MAHIEEGQRIVAESTKKTQDQMLELRHKVGAMSELTGGHEYEPGNQPGPRRPARPNDGVADIELPEVAARSKDHRSTARAGLIVLTI